MYPVDIYKELVFIEEVFDELVDTMNKQKPSTDIIIELTKAQFKEFDIDIPTE